MPVEGAIARAAKRQIAVTWDALSSDDRFGGDASLEETIEVVEESLFGRSLSPVEEDTLPKQVSSYAGKLVALDLIPAGIDYWMNLTIQETVQGPDESTLYANRAAELRELRNVLLEQTRAAEAQVLPLIPPYIGQRHTGFPRTNTVNDEFLTPSHQEFPRPYRITDRS